MTENATIFIPDISGYTNFLSKTELDHSSHIINELLELLVESNQTNCTLAEVEGDALLFYRKGEPVPLAEITAQCVEMFQRFHTLLRVIERDSICQCGACQTASNLTLKFIVHYGAIKEIKVANFVKASGLDMIIAHRLLKNKINSDEYILATRAYLERSNGHAPAARLNWQPTFEEYPAIGKVDFNYALLEEIKRAIPAAPARETPNLIFNEDLYEVEIAAPMQTVYQLIISLENRVEWVIDVRRSEGDRPIDRVGVQHRCVFEEMTSELTPVHTEVQEDNIHYLELSHVPAMGLKWYYNYALRKKDERRTHFAIQLGAEKGQELPPEVYAMVLQSIEANGERLKSYCEAHA